MPSFAVQVALKLRDDLSRPLTKVWERVEDMGDRVAKSIGKKLRDSLSVENLMGGVKNLALAGAGGLAAGISGVAVAVNEVTDSMAKTARMAKAQNIDATLLGALQNLGAREGMENLDEIGRATEEFLLRWTELKQNDPTGELYSNLKDVGGDPFIKQLKNAKSETEALGLALSALATEKKESHRIRLADAMFGGSDQGLDLRRIVKDADAVRDLFANQEKYAGASNEQYDAAVRLQRAQAELRASLKSLANTFGAEAAPAVQKLVDRITAWIEANRELLRGKIREFAEKLQKGVERLIAVDWEAWIKKAWDALSDTVEVITKLARALIDAGKVAADVFGAMGIGIDELVLGAELFFAMWAADKVAKVLGALKQITAVATATGRSMAGIAGALGAAALAGWEIGTALDNALGLSDKLAASMAEAAKPVGTQAPQQLSSEALAFGQGKIDPAQQRYFAQMGTGWRTTEQAAAEQIVNQAERAGLIKNGKLNAEEAQLQFQRGGQSFQQARQSVAGLQRAQQVDAAAERANLIVLPTGQIVNMDKARAEISAQAGNERAARELNRALRGTTDVIKKIGETYGQLTTAASRGKR